MSFTSAWCRCHVWQGSLLVLLLLTGCATSVTSWKMPWAKPVSSLTAQPSAGSEPNFSTEQASQTAGANPFRTAGEQKTAQSSPAVDNTLAAQSVAGPAGQISPKFDPATMMLIETEFKDASPAERKQWFEELRQVPPEMVPQILRMRRLALQAAQTEAKSTPVVSPSPEEQLQTAHAVSPPAKNVSPGANNLLGAMAPWDDPTKKLPAEPSSQPSSQVVRQVDHTATGGNQITPALATLKPNQPTDLTDYQPTAGEPERVTEQAKTVDTQVTYQQALQQLIAISEQKVANLTPGELEEERLNYAAQHAYLRMLYLMADRQERALEAIPKLPTAEQEYWQQMFWAISSYFDSTGIPNPADRATHTVAQLTEANLSLRERANLELRNLSFCKKIDGFGIYERFERDEFRPGQPVLVYAEMRNFLSEPTSDGQYKTILKSTIEIHRAGSHSGLVTRQDFTPTEDMCRNRRQDYFHSYMINIPERVTVGPHILKLIVEDQLNRKVASYTVNFTVN